MSLPSPVPRNFSAIPLKTPSTTCMLARWNTIWSRSWRRRSRWRRRRQSPLVGVGNGPLRSMRWIVAVDGPRHRHRPRSMRDVHLSRTVTVYLVLGGIAIVHTKGGGWVRPDMIITWQCSRGHVHFVTGRNPLVFFLLFFTFLFLQF